MAPRATVKQAIELLKIHQLRRENAAIFQQVQSSRNEAADLHDVYKELRKHVEHIQAELEKRSTSIQQHDTQISQIQTGFNNLKRAENAFQTQLEELKDKCTTHCVETQAKEAEILDKIAELNTDIVEKDKICKSNNADLIEKVDNLQLQLEKDTVTKQLSSEEASQRRRGAQKGLVSDIDSLEKSTSCIYDSVERVTKQNHNDQDAQQTRGANNHFEELLSAGLGDEEILGSYPRGGQPSSRVPSDIDLDDDHLNSSHNNTGDDGEAESLRIMAEQVETRTIVLEQVLPLKQQAEEGLASYLARGYDLMQKLPAEAEDVIVRRLVGHMSNASERQAFCTWLTSTTWAKQDLQDVTALFGIKMVNLPDVVLTDTPPISILIPATNDIGREDCLESDCGGKTPQRTISQPRRSRRLARKCRNQVDEPLERVSRNSDLSDYVQASTVSHINMSQPETVAERYQPKVTTLQHDKVLQARDRNILSNRSILQNKSLGVNDDIRPTKIADVADLGIEFSESVKIPRTPSRGILRGRSLQKPPQKPVALPLILTKVKVACPVMTKPQPQRSKENEAVLSPYDPRPRLVSHMDRSVTNALQQPHVSDSVTMFPVSKPHTNQMKSPVKINDTCPPRKKQRLPLPPPPEIPILSTSTEEDRRFDMW